MFPLASHQVEYELVLRRRLRLRNATRSAARCHHGPVMSMVELRVGANCYRGPADRRSCGDDARGAAATTIGNERKVRKSAVKSVELLDTFVGRLSETSSFLTPPP